MLTLITGGSASGKSKFAEQFTTSLGNPNLFYIATMIPFDEEAKRKIERHRIMRQEKKFHTIECYHNIETVQLPKDSCILLECMSNLTANEYFAANSIQKHTAERIVSGINQLLYLAEHLTIVTNEVFSDGLVYSDDTMGYMRELGTINRLLAKEADNVIEVVYGIPICHKGGIYEAV